MKLRVLRKKGGGRRKVSLTSKGKGAKGVVVEGDKKWDEPREDSDEVLVLCGSRVRRVSKKVSEPSSEDERTVEGGSREEMIPNEPRDPRYRE